MGRKPWKNVSAQAQTEESAKAQERAQSVLSESEYQTDDSPTKPPCCGQCSSSFVRRADNGVDLRICKRNPPIFTGGDHWDEKAWNQPIVMDNDYCDEFKANN